MKNKNKKTNIILIVCVLVAWLFLSIIMTGRGIVYLPSSKDAEDIFGSMSYLTFHV